MFKSFVQEARGDERGSGLCGLTMLTWFLLSLVDLASSASSAILWRCEDSFSVGWLGSDGRSVPPDEWLKRWLISSQRFFSRGAERERSHSKCVLNRSLVTSASHVFFRDDIVNCCPSTPDRIAPQGRKSGRW
jgi:hypothetical protein